MMNEAAASESESDTIMMFCASCGTAEAEGDDGIKLKDCSACHLVKYCSVKCQKEHRPKHKKACKKRAAELRDEILFKQPESNHFGDCPICCLPLSSDERKNVMMSCCSKLICIGCTFADMLRDIEGRRRLQNTCPFCRTATPDTDEGTKEQIMKRIEANDPVAMCSMGTKRYYGGDHKAAFEYWSRAVALGDVRANYELSALYREGRGVEKDIKRALHHLAEAAIGGHPIARFNLGRVEEDNGRMDRAAKHWIIAAKLGEDKSLQAVTKAYRNGYVSKDDFEAALRGHKAAVDATNSRQREAAIKFFIKV